MDLEKRGIHWYLTDEEVQFIRDQLKSMRPKETYEPGKWFMSILNRKPEVLGAALPDHMPEKVLLRDITLRTIEQTPGVAVTPEERLRMARALVEAGVPSYSGWHVWEGGSPGDVKKEVQPDRYSFIPFREQRTASQ